MSVKITDFSLSKMKDFEQTNVSKCGTPYYTAPEIFSKSGDWNHEVDIYSVGVIV
jgi:serine/threonine protein kinase